MCTQRSPTTAQRLCGEMQDICRVSTRLVGGCRWLVTQLLGVWKRAARRDRCAKRAASCSIRYAHHRYATSITWSHEKSCCPPRPSRPIHACTNCLTKFARRFGTLESCVLCARCTQEHDVTCCYRFMLAASEMYHVLVDCFAPSDRSTSASSDMRVGRFMELR